MTERLECKCGGTLHKSGNQYICENCDSVYLISANDMGELFAYQSVEKKQIQTGQIAPKAAAIPINRVAVRQIKLHEDIDGQVARESKELDSRNRLALIEGYLSTADWEKVDEHINAILLENKDHPEARWYSWLRQKKATGDQQMVVKLTDFSHADAVRLDSILQFATPAFAKRLVRLFFDGGFANDSMCFYVLNVILPYARNELVCPKEELAQRLRRAFERVILSTYARSFDFLLENALQAEDVDIYVTYVARFAANCHADQAQVYYRKALAIDPGNPELRRKLVQSQIKSDTFCQATLAAVELLIAYSDDVDRDIEKLIRLLCNEAKTTINKSDIMWGLLSYHSTAPQGLKQQLLDYGHVLLESKLWLRARDFFNLVLSFDVHCGDAYWGLCMVQMQARNEQDVIKMKEPIKSFSAYDKALAVFSAAGNGARVNYLKELSEKQKNQQEQLKRKLIIGAIILIVLLLALLNN